SQGDCAADGERWVRGLLSRPADFETVLASLGRRDQGPAALLQRLDLSRLAILGHSQGGHVAFLLPTEDSRIRAAIAISPSLGHPDPPDVVWKSVAASRCPTMIVYGGRDASWPEDGPKRGFNQLPTTTPRAFLRIADMAHTPSTRADLEIVGRYVHAW